MALYFEYGLDAIGHLKKKDKRLGSAIDRIGPIQRKTEDDLFTGVVHHIVGQQISTAAQATVWGRLRGLLGEVCADTICLCSREALQSCGITFKKADYILDFARKVQSGEFNVEALRDMADRDVIATLSSLNGIGVWTAEMLMILQMAKMVAESIMRQYSRYYDEHEHERPVEYINMMWPIMREQYKRRTEKLQLNGNGSGPQKKEGPDYSIVRLIFMIEMLSWGDAGQYLCTPDPALVGAALEAVGTKEQKIRILGKFGEGDPKWGAMAMTESDAGSDTSNIRTTAVFDEEANEWVLNGEKIFCTNGGLALDESDGFVVVWATVDPSAGRAGMKSFIVESGSPGVSVTKKEHKLGIRVSDTVSIVFDNARIPADNILGSAEVTPKDGSTKGFKGAMATFDASRPAVAASAMGICRAALEFSRDKLKEEGIEVDYTKPKNQMSAIERDLLEMEARHKAAWLLTLRSVALMAHGKPNRLEASMCKARAGETVTWVTQKAVELLGPMGYTREWLTEKWMRDAKINDIYEGTKQINTLIVARSILGYSRRELK